MDQGTGEDLNPTRSRQPVGGEISEMARNPDRYCTILPTMSLFGLGQMLGEIKVFV